MKYFGIVLSILVKDVFQAKNEKLVNNINDILIDLINTIIRKNIPENENPEKIITIVKKFLNFNNQQKGKGLKILTPRQMLQILQIALAILKAGNSSGNLLNEIRQIIYSLH